MGGLQWSNDGSRIAFTAQDRVFVSAFVYDVRSGRYTRLTKDMMIRAPSYSRDGARVAFAMDSPKSPADVYVTDASFATPRRLTTVNPQLATIALGEAEVITWRSSDGWQVEGVLLKPVGYQSGRRYPLKVDVHGGPTGAHSNGFKAGWGSPG